MLATFSSKMGCPVGRRLPFCWVYVIFRFLGRPGPLLAQFGLDFGGFGSILEVFGVHFGSFWSRFGCHVACNFGTFSSCSFLKLPLVRGGLVGLREALTISFNLYLAVLLGDTPLSP